MKRFLCLSFILLFAASFAFSADFGLLIDQKLETEKIENQLLTYTPAVTPWFSWNGGKGVSLYLSAVLSLEYKRTDAASGWHDPFIIPELGRSAFSWRNDTMSFEAGRINYQDACGFIAAGLFDGFSFQAVTSGGIISAGVFYTGLLYRETAKIIMTQEDNGDYAAPWDFSDNFKYYFSSKRLFASVRWSYPLSEMINLNAQLLAQFDLNGREQGINSQYAQILADLYPAGIMKISLGALFETMQYGGEFGIGFGALARFSMDLPTSLNDSLNLAFKFTSGYKDAKMPGFIPISGVQQGMIFTEGLSGLAVIGLDYDIMIIKSLTAQAAFKYFIRTYEAESGGGLYGGEFWASLAWQPFNDIRAALGGGAFIPAMGNVNPDADMMWKISASVILSF
uniref:Uncharacterized protein n=1 Tax=uncultured bacterium contig00115 TaxID=1181577 RepID=A0A806KI57_9BACT|nr:hypothetical protein [uncultured bacterium contig00115]